MVELPDPDEPEDSDEPEPVAPEAPLLGVLGEVGELLPEPAAPELELPLAPELVPPVAPLELDPDLLKWASHSEREIWPSLLVSTAEKVGSAMLELAPLELEPDADGVLLLPELCAMATPERASSAAAVALVTSFNIDIPP